MPLTVLWALKFIISRDSIHHEDHVYSWQVVASFPGLHPSFCRLQYENQGLSLHTVRKKASLGTRLSRWHYRPSPPLTHPHPHPPTQYTHTHHSTSTLPSDDRTLVLARENRISFMVDVTNTADDEGLNPQLTIDVPPGILFLNESVSELLAHP